MREKIEQIPNVLATPKLEVLKFTPMGPVLAVRPYCHNNYWQVYFETNRIIREAFGEAGFPAPEHHVYLRGAAASQSAFSAPLVWKIRGGTVGGFFDV